MIEGEESAQGEHCWIGLCIIGEETRLVFQYELSGVGLTEIASDPNAERSQAQSPSRRSYCTSCGEPIPVHYHIISHVELIVHS